MEQEVDGRLWAKAWTTTIGLAVRRYRTRARITAEELSTQTAKLGYTLSRNAITALETGRKEFVTIQDLTVLALALKVVPALLLFPVDETLDAIDLLPGGPRLERIEAVDWFSGEDIAPESLPGNDDPYGRRTWMLNNNILFWLRGHAEGVRRWHTALDRQSAAEQDESIRSHYEVLRLDAERQIRGNRAQLSAIGAPLPDLPPGLNVDGPPAPDPLGRKNIATVYLSGRAHQFGEFEAPREPIKEGQ